MLSRAVSLARRCSFGTFASLTSVAVLALAGSVSCASSAPESSPEVALEVDAPRGLGVPVHAPFREQLTFGDALADESGAHLAISLRLEDEDGLTQLLADQQNPASTRYHQWVTPEQFGARFGLSEEAYARIVDWLGAEGFSVTRYPNRLFVEAHGTSGAVRRLLKVQPRWASARGRTFRSYAEDLVIPADIAAHVVKVGGLDTRLHLRRRMNVTFQGQATQVLGAPDMRALYDVPSTGTGASGLTLVVLATQQGTTPKGSMNPGAPFVPPSTPAIQQYLTSVSAATVAYNPIVIPNTADDFDTDGANGEYELDVEMQSVGAPNAKEIDLVLAPSSEVFQTGAQYVVNTLSSAVVVSSSLGLCESEEVSSEGSATAPGAEPSILQVAVKQGLAEGQTWFAAAGDDGADDCADQQSSGTNNGFGGKNATVDFPCSLPELICMGGTQLAAKGAWNASGVLTDWQSEVVWNEADQQSAGGGGQSLMYTKPAYQTGVGPMASDGARDVPDISLSAAIENPGVGTYDLGTATSAGAIDIVGGTSVASPLAAGFFAHLSGAVGCRLGDIHSTIYTLGAAQLAGGTAPFHDITTGNNDMADPSNVTITGFAAGAGFDLASGWGSVDLGKLIAAWPPCTGTGTPDGGTSSTELDGGSGTVGSSSGGSVSTGSDGGASGGATTKSGCGCTTAGRASPSGAPLAGLFAALGLAASRRRRRNGHAGG
jgi:MYXO-CTERM domain-containing protein